MAESFDPHRIVRVLGVHAVDFIVIGGVAADIQGAGWPTLDLDIVARWDDENLARLVSALGELDARYEGFYRKPIRPTPERFAAARGPHLLRTAAGRLDVLSEAGGETYESLALDAVDVDFEEGVRILIASVPALLRMKRAAGRPKDAAGIEALEKLARARKGQED